MLSISAIPVGSFIFSPLNCLDWTVVVRTFVPVLVPYLNSVSEGLSDPGMTSASLVRKLNVDPESSSNGGGY